MSYNKSDIVEGHYELFAKGSVHLLSGGRLINIQGTSDFGSVRINGPDDVTLSSGAAHIAVHQVDNVKSGVAIFGGMMGEIGLTTGLPNLGPIVKLNEDSIVLQVGPDVGGASLRLSATSLDIKIGLNEWKLDVQGLVEKIGPHKREFNPEGQTVTVGPTKVRCTLQGISEEALTLETEIKTTINEKSLLKNENVSGILTLKAAITNIN